MAVLAKTLVLDVAHLLTDNIGIGCGQNIFMKQLTEQYWPQHRVFFMGVLALFSDKLNGHEVNQWFYRPFFVGDNPDFIQLELEEYRKAGYLKYEKPGALYKITDINTEKATKDLTQYLKKWQQNKLVLLSAKKPPDSAYQRKLLLDAIVHARANHQSEPRVTLEDVYGNGGDYAYNPPFWEIALSYQLLDGKVEIKDLGYDQRIDGLYEDNIQPFVEYEITDKKLLGLVERRAAQEAESATPTTSSDIVPALPDSLPAKREGRVIKDRRLIIIAIAGDQNYTVARLEDGGSYDRFMDYVLDAENADIDISIEDVNALKGTLQSAKDLTELIRHSGFSKQLKLAFFPTSKGGKIRFTAVAMLSGQQIETVKKQAEKVKAKYRE